MTLREILTELEILEGQLDDAYYQLPEYDANQDSRSSLDSTRNDLYVLKDNLERAVLDGAEVTVQYEDVKKRK
jgi:hypothetical protein